MAEFLQTGTEYNIELTKEDVPCQVEIGGTTEKFVPNINASKWNAECWLNINHPDVVSAEIERVIGDKIELTVGENTHRYYETNGRLEYEIELLMKPRSNVITLDLSFPDGLSFHEQTEANKDSPEDYRPDNVINSYAVYWKKRDHKVGGQNYKTGKFCHICRSNIIAAEDEWTW